MTKHISIYEKNRHLQYGIVGSTQTILLSQTDPGFLKGRSEGFQGYGGSSHTDFFQNLACHKQVFKHFSFCLNH